MDTGIARIQLGLPEPKDPARHVVRLQLGLATCREPFPGLQEANRAIEELRAALASQEEIIRRLQGTQEPGTVLVIEREVRVPVQVVVEKPVTVERVITKVKYKPIGYSFKAERKEVSGRANEGLGLQDGLVGKLRELASQILVQPLPEDPVLQLDLIARKLVELQTGQQQGRQKLVELGSFLQKSKATNQLIVKRLVLRGEGLLGENKQLRAAVQKSLQPCDRLVDQLRQEVDQLRAHLRKKDEQIYHLKGLCVRTAPLTQKETSLQKQLADCIAGNNKLQLRLAKAQEQNEGLQERLRVLDPGDATRPVEDSAALRLQVEELKLQLVDLLRSKNKELTNCKQTIQQQKNSVQALQTRLREEKETGQETRRRMVMLQRQLNETEERVGLLVSQYLEAEDNDQRKSLVGQLLQVLASRANARVKALDGELKRESISQLLDLMDGQFDNERVMAALLEHSPASMVSVLKQKCDQIMELRRRLQMGEGREQAYQKVAHRKEEIQRLKEEVAAKDRLLRRLVYRPTVRGARIEVEERVAVDKLAHLVGTAACTSLPSHSNQGLKPRIARLQQSLGFLKNSWGRKGILRKSQDREGSREAQAKVDSVVKMLEKEDDSAQQLVHQLKQGALRGVLYDLLKSLEQKDVEGSRRLAQSLTEQVRRTMGLLEGLPRNLTLRSEKLSLGEPVVQRGLRGESEEGLMQRLRESGW